MKKIETNSDVFFKFEDVLDASFCQFLNNYSLNKVNANHNNLNKTLPWLDEKVISWNNIDDKNLKQDILKYKFLLTQLIHDCYKTIVFPIFTDLVVWQKGKKMQIHHDDNHDDGVEDKLLKKRIISTVTYLNEDFVGGETVIYKNNKEFFTNKPKTGSVLIFTSDNRCKHSVNEIISGTRVTMPIWFTNDIDFLENF